MSAAYAATVAPYPKSTDDDPAEKLARFLTCLVQGDIVRTVDHYYLASPPGDRAAAREYGLVVGRLVGHYGVLKLLRVLIDTDRVVADSAARRLIDDWDGGESMGGVGVAMARRLRH